jgi:hypothetical protein
LNKRIAALALASLMILGMAYTAKSAYAHNFSGDESASFLAKVQELKVETHLIQQNLSNQTLVAWHVDKTGEFWNSNDTKEMAERNQRLSQEIPDGLASLFNAANSTSPDAAKVKQIVDALDNSLEEAVTARIDQTARNNATVNALAVAAVLDETLEDYGDATGANFDLNDMSNMGSMNGTESGSDNMTSSTEGNNNMSMNENNNMSTGSTSIENMAAYQTAQGLAAAAQNMFNDLKSKAPANMTSAINKADQGFINLKDSINNRASPNDVMTIVHSAIHPNLQTAFNLQVVPEFPLPLLLIIPAIAGIIAATRITAQRKR